MSKKLNIGMVLPALPGYSESFFYNKIKGLIEDGFRVSLFVARKVDPEAVRLSVPIHYQVNVNNKLYLLFSFITTCVMNPLKCIGLFKLEMGSHGDWTRSLKNLIINIHIIGKPLDWLHFGFATTSLGRENLALAMGIKAAVSLRGFDIGLYPHHHPDCYNLLWLKIDRVHTISDDLYQKALDLGLDSKTPYQKITPAINPVFFKSKSFKNLHDPLRILTVGRLTWKKGYEYALKALSLLKDKQINFEYHIVGEGNYREAIIYGTHQLRLAEHIKLKGALSPEDVKKEMEWADIYIQPSIQEGFCNAVLEAQAMGLLCIVTDADGLSENVLDGETGWVVWKRSPQFIFERIKNIISLDLLSLNKIRMNAVNRVTREFNLRVQREGFIKFYKN